MSHAITLNLPTEMHYAIFNHLDVNDLFLVKQVCILWNKMVNECAEIWENIALNKKFILTSGPPIKAQVLTQFVPYWRAACTIFPPLQEKPRHLHPACMHTMIDSTIRQAGWPNLYAQTELIAYLQVPQHQMDTRLQIHIQLEAEAYQQHDVAIWVSCPSLTQVNSSMLETSEYKKNLGMIQVFLEAGAILDETTLSDFFKNFAMHGMPLPLGFCETATYLAYFIPSPSAHIASQTCSLHWSLCEINNHRTIAQLVDLPLYAGMIIRNMSQTVFDNWIQDLRSERSLVSSGQLNAKIIDGFAICKKNGFSPAETHLFFDQLISSIHTIRNQKSPLFPSPLPP